MVIKTPALPVATCETRPSCRHREFDIARGDQATSTHSLALTVALIRVPGRGRQRITKHVSAWARMWLVQDVDAAAVTS